jgi:hypothetical protein
LSLSVLPEFISQDYRFGFLATIKHNSNRQLSIFFGSAKRRHKCLVLQR